MRRENEGERDMNVIQDHVFFRELSAAGEGTPMTGMTHESQVVLRVDGSATAFSVQVLGAFSAADAEQADGWTELAVIDLSNFAVAQSIQKTGVYAVAADGMWAVKAVAVSVSGGTLTARGKAGD